MKLLLGLILLPIAVAVGIATFQIILSIPSPHGALLPELHWFFLAGVAVWLAIWVFCPRPFRAYVLGHELTHLIFGLLCGAKAGKITVNKNGGSVLLSKDNLLISLSPYFVPFYTFVVLLVYGVWYLVSSPVPCAPLWYFLIGATWAFHATFTVSALLVRQSDVKDWGYVFSYSFILIFNLLFTGIWIVCTTAADFSQYGELLLSNLKLVFSSMYQAALWIYRFAVEKVA